MPAELHRFQSKKQRLGVAEAAALRQHILAFDEFELPEDAAGRIIGAIDQQTAATNGWTFVMLSPAQNAAVVGWLATQSTRPIVAVRMWAEMLTALRIDTGEVMLTRDELAQRLEVRTNAVTDILTDLERIGAISRRRTPVKGMRGPGRVSVFVSPLVATHLAGAKRSRAQDAAPKPPIETVV